MQTHDTSPLSQVQDEPSKILNILSFVCPPIGLVIYLSLIGKMPRQALSAGLCAAKGVATLFALCFLVALSSFGMWLADDVFHLFGNSQAEPAVTVEATPPHL